MTHDYKTLGAAAWDNDSLADEGHQLPEIVDKLGADPEAVIRVAEQRALRMTLALSRGSDAAVTLTRDAYEQRKRAYKLTAQELRLQSAMAAVWIDGLTTGLRVSQSDSESGS